MTAVVGRTRMRRFGLVGLVVAGLLLTVAPQALAERPPRIVGGKTTTISQHPWQVGLLIGETAGVGTTDLDRFFCGGSLITRRVVLTAGHCVFDTDPELLEAGTRLDPDDADVIAGRTRVTDATPAEIDIAEVRIHGGFDPETLDNDVAYLELTAPAPVASPDVETIRLAGSDDRSLWLPGVQTVVSGWGTTSEGGAMSNTLKEAVVPIFASQTCASPDVYGEGFVTAIMTCAGFLEGGTDSCQGDSGGPLTTPKGGARRLIGVVSFGNGCARPGFPGVYARVGCPPLRSHVVSTVASMTSETLSVSGTAACDDTPPETVIDKGPKKKVKTTKKRAKAKFKFSASEAAVTFQCSVDGGLPEPCTSPFKIKTKKGKHSFFAVATDQFGNSDETPALRNWKVKRRKKK
jgi:trypsin